MGSAGSHPRLYVYYRVANADLAPTVAAVQTLQARLQRDHAGLQAELLRRPAEPDLPQNTVTLMEVYSHRDGLAPEMALRIEACALQAVAPWLIGQRHLERFEPLG